MLAFYRIYFFAADDLTRLKLNFEEDTREQTKMRYIFPRLVPWYNEKEWNHVYELLYSQNIQNQLEGVQMVTYGSALKRADL